ncbi:unnamed protein product [Rotaria sp. Silwood2]|nr:unnamed protein product [Rotaria sp. Silwood2]
MSNHQLLQEFVGLTLVDSNDRIDRTAIIATIGKIIPIDDVESFVNDQTFAIHTRYRKVKLIRLLNIPTYMSNDVVRDIVSSLYWGVFTYSRGEGGSPSQLLSRSARVAAVCLGPEATTAWKNSGAQWEAVSSRIVTLRIECRLVPITIIAVYAPIDPSNGVKNNIETCDEFYKTLQATIDKTRKSDMIMIRGDFNARVGVEQANSAGGTVGKHAIDKQNQNGRRLVDFCLFNSFIVTNTFFPYKTVHQGTWMHPKTKQWHMLDYILVNRKFRSGVQDVRVHRGAIGGIGTDHHLLRAKILLQQIPGPTVDNEELSRQNAVPTLDEVVKAIGQNKNKKAPGKDDLPAELLKAGGLYVAEWLHEIIRDVWEQEVMVKE